MNAPSRVRPVTRGDAPEIVDLLNACDVAEIGEPDTTLEDLENDWAMDGFDPGRDAWVAEGPHGLVAYDHGDLGWIQELGVRAPWRRRGLGAALLAHAFAAFRTRGQARVDLGVDAEGATRPLQLYERAGMQASVAYGLYSRRLAD